MRTLVEAGGDLPSRLDWLSRRILARAFRPEETAIVQRSLQGLLDYYHHHVADAEQLLAVGDSPPDCSLHAAELAAWTMLVNQLMNMDEVLNK